MGRSPSWLRHRILIPASARSSRARSAIFFTSGCGAAGSAGALGASGRRFETCHPDQNKERDRAMQIVLSRKPAIKIGWHRNPYPETIVTHQGRWPRGPRQRLAKPWSLTRPTRSNRVRPASCHRGCSSEGERLLCKQRVIGSIPFISTNICCSVNSVWSECLPV